MPWKKKNKFTLLAYYFFIHAGLEKWSNLLSFRSSTERYFISTALSFISRPYLFFPSVYLQITITLQTGYAQSNAICNLQSAQSLKLYAILRSKVSSVYNLNDNQFCKYPHKESWNLCSVQSQGFWWVIYVIFSFLLKILQMQYTWSIFKTISFFEQVSSNYLNYPRSFKNPQDVLRYLLI